MFFPLIIPHCIGGWKYVSIGISFQRKFALESWTSFCSPLRLLMLAVLHTRETWGNNNLLNFIDNHTQADLFALHLNLSFWLWMKILLNLCLGEILPVWGTICNLTWSWSWKKALNMKTEDWRERNTFCLLSAINCKFKVEWMLSFTVSGN